MKNNENERSEEDHAAWKILRDLGMSSEVADDALRLLSRFRSAKEPEWPDWTEQQVQAALDAWYASGHHRPAVGMRSALNAACGAWVPVKQEGESS